MWSTRNALAAALLIGVAACGGTDEASSPPAYLPDSVREQQERESVQIERLDEGLTSQSWLVRSLSGEPMLHSPHERTVFKFDSDGRLSALIGPCRFDGNWTRDGVKMEMQPFDKGDEGCLTGDHPQLLELKRTFESVIIAGIADEGLLFLSTLDGQAIEAELANQSE